MDFAMEIDNPRKRYRDEPELQSFNDFPVTKKARQSDMNASTRDSTPSLSESTPSTPASVDVDMDAAPQQHQIRVPEPRPQPRSGSTIISGWNQCRREQYLKQGYPLAWVQTSAQ
ncbi:hypothetical protein VTH82DRAFT_1326 [Thermothelomyces myriococcoides]